MWPWGASSWTSSKIEGFCFRYSPVYLHPSASLHESHSLSSTRAHAKYGYHCILGALSWAVRATVNSLSSPMCLRYPKFSAHLWGGSRIPHLLDGFTSCVQAFTFLGCGSSSVTFLGVSKCFFYLSLKQNSKKNYSSSNRGPTVLTSNPIPYT